MDQDDIAVLSDELLAESISSNTTKSLYNSPEVIKMRRKEEETDAFEEFAEKEMHLIPRCALFNPPYEFELNLGILALDPEPCPKRLIYKDECFLYCDYIICKLKDGSLDDREELLRILKSIG